MKKRYPLKQTFLITFLALFFILLVKPIDIDNIDHIPVDILQYSGMAQKAPDLSPDTWEPYAYRVMGPWLAGTLFQNPDQGFYLINILFLIGMALALWDLLFVYGIKTNPAFLIVISFMLNRYYFSFLAYDFYQLNDTISITCLWFSLSLLKRRNYLLILPIALVGMLAREVLLIWIPVSIFILYKEGSVKRDWVWTGFISVLLMTVFIGLKLSVAAKGGISLVQAIGDDWSKIYDPFAIAKQLFIANTPLFLLPVIFYKDLMVFIKERSELLILLGITYLTTLFGHDYERLMTPAAPFIYLFSVTLIQKFFPEDNSKFVKFGLAFFLIIFVGNFYHLWGVIILPNRIYSLALAIASASAMGILFFYTQLKKR